MSKVQKAVDKIQALIDEETGVGRLSQSEAADVLEEIAGTCEAAAEAVRDDIRQGRS